MEAARYIQDNHPPFEMYWFTSDYKVTFNSGCITSLYMDESTYMGGAHGSVTRSSDTWDFASGKRLQLEDFHPGNFFLVPDGIIIYYQQYDIAPYAAGIPEFLIPFSQHGPRI